MPAMIGMRSDRLLPAAPWHAEHVSDLAKPGSSSGPPDAVPASAPQASPMVTAMKRFIAGIRPSEDLGENVVPDALGPAERALGHAHALRGGELLLDLDHLAVLDLVRVDDGDGLAVAHPAIAGIARGEWLGEL